MKKPFHEDILANAKPTSVMNNMRRQHEANTYPT
jgi:hypothetical protein